MTEAHRKRVALRATAWLAAGTIAGSLVHATPSGGVSDVRSVLERPYAEDTRTREEVVDGLVSLGSGAVPTLFRLYTGEGWQELFENAERVDAEEWWCPPDRFHGLFLEALGGMSASRVADFLDEHVAEDAAHETRLAAVRVLGEVASPDGLESLFRLAETFGSLPLRYRSVQAPLEDAFEATLLSSPVHVSRDLPELVDGAHPGVASTLLVAISRTGRPEYLSVVARMMRGEDDEVALEALELLPELVSRAPWRFEDAPGELVQGYLTHEDWRFRRAAAFAVGRMHDAGSFARTILLLDDPHPAVSSAARWALVEVSGVDGPGTSTEWIEWHDEQVRWWEDAGEGIADRLASGDPRAVSEAVRELVARPLFRDRAAAELAELLERDDPDLLRVVLKALQEIGSKRVVPELVWLVESRDEGVRTAALHALGRLTGAELPPDRDAWRTLVEG